MLARVVPATGLPATREHLPRYRDLGELEGHVAPMADDLRANLDQLFLQACQRPVLDLIGYRQRPHEVAQIVGERVKLKADGVGGEGAA